MANTSLCGYYCLKIGRYSIKSLGIQKSILTNIEIDDNIILMYIEWDADGGPKHGYEGI
jgi:hypothetical protein